MNSINHRIGAAALLLVLACAAGCGDRNSASTVSQTGPAGTPDPGSKVIGVEPAPPKPEPATTTSTAPSTVSKEQETKAMPLPGQVNDHSTLAKNPSQKAGAKGK